MKAIDFKKAIELIDDDFELAFTIVEDIPEEKLKHMSYPFPHMFHDAKIEIVDIAYSERKISIFVYKTE